MHIVRHSAGTLQKAVASGGGVAFTADKKWQQTSFGPGTPIPPVTNPQYLEVPRSIDYPISVNAQLTPRAGYNILPFGELNAIYEYVTECKLPVWLILRELGAFVPNLVDKKGNNNSDHPYQW